MVRASTVGTSTEKSGKEGARGKPEGKGGTRRSNFIYLWFI
jgi:hypothetical protein